jgi:hypothetical protein
LKEEIMSNGTRTPTFLVVFAVSIAGCWFIGCTRHEPESFQLAPGNHLIKVGPTAKEVGSSMKKVHKMAWKARGDKLTLEIRFKATEFPLGAKDEPPFEGGANKTDQVFTCGPGAECDSGPVNHLLNPPVEGLYYKYWQTLIHEDGTKDPADAGIIIER